MPGLINRDFADIKTVMSEMGKAMMGTGEMDGEGRALRAAEAAISNPLLDDVSMKGARAVLVNVTGGPDLMLFEVDEAVNRIRAEVDPDANILFGSALSEDMEGRVRVSVVATGIDADTCVRLGDNVQRLNVRRRLPEVEVPSAPPSPAPAARAHFEPIVRQQVGNLVQEYMPAAEAALAEAVAAVMPIVEEPMTLGGIEAPIMEEPRQQPPLREFAPMSAPRERERRGMFGLFGGRRRSERISRDSEPVMQKTRMPMPSQPDAHPIARAPQGPTMQPAPQPQVQAAQAAQPMPAQPAAPSRPSEPRPQGQASGDDLFAGVSEDDRFEIPAFLRRQAKMGS